MKLSSPLPLLIAALSLNSCYTGVERTPRITERQVNREIGTPSAESKFLSSIEGQPPAEWLPGKVFTLTNGKFNVAYLPSSISSTLSPGDTLRFESMEAATTLTGAGMTNLRFKTSDGRSLTYRMETPFETLRSAPSASLPFLVEATVVDSVRALLKGRTLWTTTLRRYTPDGNDIPGRKFERITVSDIRAGKGEYPIEVLFGNEMLYLTVEPGSRSTRRFSNILSLSDPRKNYKHITDKNWELITRGKVADGMTMEECRLALGTPKEVDRTATYGALIERWTYENGIYLLFSDGLLTRFRR